MSLVLAIEPDAAQTAILRDIARSLAIERLEIVASNDDALRFLLREIPDLILVTALQAPGEEDALLAHLRTLADASHLQTLTIPQLRSPAQAASGSLRFRFRRRAGSAPAGCDPDVFREQVRAYLAWAAEVRSHAIEADVDSGADAFEPDGVDFALADIAIEQVDVAMEPAVSDEAPQGLQAVAGDGAEEWIEVALDGLTDGGTEVPPYVPSSNVPAGEMAGGLEARYAEELAQLQAETEALRAAAAEEALRGAAIEKARLHAEAEARQALERARLQAEAEAREAVERARVEAEAEARTMLTQELASVRQHAEQAFADTLSRVREEAAETLAAEVGRARQEAALLQQTELTRVESEAEARLQGLLDDARAAAEQARQTDLADAKWRAEEVRDAAAREARAAAEVAAASTLSAEIARVRADAEQRVAAEVARVRADAEQQRAAELELLRAQIAEVKESAATRAATVIVAPAATREPQRLADAGPEPKWTVPTRLTAARKTVSTSSALKKEPRDAPSQPSGSYYSLWGSDRSPARPSSAPRRRSAPSSFRRWALPIAATLVLVTSGGVVINLASFDPRRWASRVLPAETAVPAAVTVAVDPPKATPSRPKRTKARNVEAPSATPAAATAPAIDAAPQLAVSPFGSVHVTAPAGTMISIAGAQVGEAPVSLSLPAGAHEVIGAHPELGEMRQSVEVKPEERTGVSLAPPVQ